MPLAGLVYFDLIFAQCAHWGNVPMFRLQLLSVHIVVTVIRDTVDVGDEAG